MQSETQCRWCARTESWEEAMGRIVERSRALLEEKGPLAFGFYTTGQLFLEGYYALGVIGKAAPQALFVAD